MPISAGVDLLSRDPPGRRSDSRNPVACSDLGRDYWSWQFREEFYIISTLLVVSQPVTSLRLESNLQE